MILALNIGNTHILLGVWQQDQLLFRATLSAETSRSTDEYAIQLLSLFSLHGLRPDQLEGAILSSVVPSLTARLRQAVQQLCQLRVMTVGPGLKSGLAIRIDNPAQLGSELVCAAIGALETFQPPLVVITMDTAISMMAIDARRQLLGGVILPGPEVSLEALIRRTAQLPQVDLEAAPAGVIGTNTTLSLQAGAVLGTATLLDGMLARFSAEMGGPVTAVCTGRMHRSILAACATPLEYDQDLILRGLWRIYQKNRR
ncbi:MAG TPA: type III pantothenate kinase [Candidatus Anaerofilum excrementigallinarum]|nr:type III pantothenate kinase [Candidatus Anaerofilum excrementigallinarum]